MGSIFYNLWPLPRPPRPLSARLQSSSRRRFSTSAQKISAPPLCNSVGFIFYRKPYYNFFFRKKVTETNLWSCRADGPGSSCCCALALRFGTARPCAREVPPSLCHQSHITMCGQGATCRRSSDPLGLSRHAFSRRRADGFQLAPRKYQLCLSASRSSSFSIENPTINFFFR